MTEMTANQHRGNESQFQLRKELLGDTRPVLKKIVDYFKGQFQRYQDRHLQVVDKDKNIYFDPKTGETFKVNPDGSRLYTQDN